MELASLEDLGTQGVALLKDWLKEQGNKSFATLEAKIDKFVVKPADKFRQAEIDKRRKDQVDGDVSEAIAKIDGAVSKAIAKLRALALTRALERKTA